MDFPPKLILNPFCILKVFKYISLYSTDLNVEHLQLLLFMFHNFSDVQRQVVLQDCIEAIIIVTKECPLTTIVPTALARLLLLLDYFIHHFSVPPQELLKQVQGSSSPPPPPPPPPNPNPPSFSPPPSPSPSSD